MTKDLLDEDRKMIFRIFFIGILLGALCWTFYFLMSEKCARAQLVKPVESENVVKETITAQPTECEHDCPSGC